MPRVPRYNLGCSYRRASVDLGFGLYDSHIYELFVYWAERETARNFSNRFGLPRRSYLNDANGAILRAVRGFCSFAAIVLVVRPMSSSILGA